MQQQRASVQDILKKYDTINETDDRFTFQVKVNSVTQERGTFGNQINNQAPRQSNQQAQLLSQIDQTNLSKMLSDFSIVTEQEESVCQSQFNNPMGIQNMILNAPEQPQPRQTQQEGMRGTFGINPFFQPKADVTEIIDNTYLEDDLYDDMSVLKGKVMGLLQAYSDDLQKSNDGQIKQKIQQDVQVVQLEYSKIVDKINQVDVSNLNISQNVQQKENELNNMFNLVQEFLQKFDVNQKSQSQLNFSQILEKKVNKSIYVPNQNSLDITVVQNLPLDETFYQGPQITNDKLAKKIQKLKTLLTQELEKQQMYYSKPILLEMIETLNKMLEANDIQTIKSVIFKIEEFIKQLPQLQQTSVSLYDYMAKVIQATKTKYPETQNTLPQGDELKQKRQFFDLVIQLKNKLPLEHKGRDKMISIMYNKFRESNQQNMEEFIVTELQQ